MILFVSLTSTVCCSSNYVKLLSTTRKSISEKENILPHPGDSNDGQNIPFTERQVLFVGSLEVVLGYTLCAGCPWGLKQVDKLYKKYKWKIE